MVVLHLSYHCLCLLGVQGEHITHLFSFTDQNEPPSASSTSGPDLKADYRLRADAIR